MTNSSNISINFIKHQRFCPGFDALDIYFLDNKNYVKDAYLFKKFYKSVSTPANRYFIQCHSPKR